MKNNVRLDQKYPHIFDPFVRGFGMLPQGLWHDHTDPKHHSAVDKLIARLNPFVSPGKPVPNTSFTNDFLAGMLPG